MPHRTHKCNITRSDLQPEDGFMKKAETCRCYNFYLSFNCISYNQGFFYIQVIVHRDKFL